MTMGNTSVTSPTSQTHRSRRKSPAPLQPAYEQAGTVEEATSSELLHDDVRHIFDGYALYRHQYKAIKLGMGDTDFIVTSETGWGKSLTYIGTIFNRLPTNRGTNQGKTATVVPWNP